METHVKLAAVLHILMGMMGLLGGLIVFLGLGGAGVLVGAFADHHEAIFAAPIFIIVGLIMGGFILITSLPGIIAGIGLLKYESWAKFLTMVVSILYIPFHIPFGSILGIYSLWVLLSPETEALFKK